MCPSSSLRRSLSLSFSIVENFCFFYILNLTFFVEFVREFCQKRTNQNASSSLNKIIEGKGWRARVRKQLTNLVKIHAKILFNDVLFLRLKTKTPSLDMYVTIKFSFTFIATLTGRNFEKCVWKICMFQKWYKSLTKTRYKSTPQNKTGAKKRTL